MNDQKNRTPGSISGKNLVRIAVSTALLTLTACSSDSDWDESQGLQNVPGVGAAQSGKIDVNTDVAETQAGSPVTVPVLNNDKLTADAQFGLVGKPANGTARLLDSGAVEYTANKGFEGTEVIEYVVVSADGNRTYGKLYVAVVCADCQTTDYSNNGEFPYCTNNADPDGDGYGWENNQSCVILKFGAALGPLTAKADSLSIKAGDIKTATPLRNDNIPDRSNITFTIETPPTAGHIEAAEAGVIVYAAPQNYRGIDSLVYSITDKNGATSMASIEFDITCDSCIDYKALRLTWAANPESEKVEGYRVLFGSDENVHTSTEVSNVKVQDGESPEVVFDLAEDLNLSSNEGGCFMIQAYRGADVSDTSQAACFTRGS